MKRVPLLGLGASIAALGLVTGWALEAGDVAVLETRAADGSLRSTRVWFVETEEGLWVEAGAPGNGWFVDVQRDPQVGFAWRGRVGRYLAHSAEEPGARDRLRALLRSKYGVRDWWVGLLFDTSGSVPVRLTPLRPDEGSAPATRAGR